MTVPMMDRFYGRGWMEPGEINASLKCVRFRGPEAALMDPNPERYERKCHACKKTHYHMDVRDGVCYQCEKARKVAIAKQDGKNRRVLELLAWGSHSEVEWQWLLVRTGRKCLRCGSPDDLTRDHIVPLSRGGTHSIDNIQPLCRRCNSWKATRTIDFRDNRIQEHTRARQVVEVPG